MVNLSFALGSSGLKELNMTPVFQIQPEVFAFSNRHPAPGHVAFLKKLATDLN